VFLLALGYEKQQGSTSATLESAAPTSGARGVLIPLTRKLAVSSLTKAVRPPGQGG
jgi:hypothetical protein